MSAARRSLDWTKMFELAIDPEKAKRYRAESSPENEDTLHHVRQDVRCV